MRHSVNDKKTAQKQEITEFRCNVCGRWSKNCYHEEDSLGHSLYCVCSRCMVNRGDEQQVKRARMALSKR